MFVADMENGIWKCENANDPHFYAEYVNGCPRCWDKHNELRVSVRPFLMESDLKQDQAQPAREE